MKIDEQKLKDFLNHRKSKISGPSIPYDGIFASITFLFTLLTVEHNRLTFLSNDIVFAVFWVFFIAYFIFIIVRTILAIKNKYSIETMFSELKELEKTEAQFSLLIIKSNHDNNKGKYLLLYDKRWKMFMLPYYKTNNESTENEKRASEILDNKLNLDNSKYTIEYKTVKQTEKFSVSDCRNKTYKHSFYEVNIQTVNDKLSKKSFRLKDNKYRWYSIEEMKCNKKMKAYNDDIITTISELYG